MSNSTISILNMKGGVGKTTLTTNLAIELFNRNKSILIIDIDPQFNSTQSLFKHFTNISEYFKLRDNKRTITSIFNGEKSRGISRANDNNENLIYTLSTNENGKNFDILPGDLKLIIDINANAADKLNAFFNINSLKENYDYIIFDCPPTWGQVTSIALNISNYYLIPTKLDDFSTIGITLLSDLLKDKVASLSSPLNCLGVVYTMLTETTSPIGICRKQNKYRLDIEEYFEKTMNTAVNSEVKAFDTVIYNYTPIASQSIIYAENTTTKGKRLHNSIKELTTEIISRITSQEASKVGQS